MEDGSPSAGQAYRSAVIEAIRTPLGLFSLVALVVEAIFLLLVTRADDSQRTIAISGMLLLLALLVCVVGFLVYHNRDGLTLQGESGLNMLPTFDDVCGNLDLTIGNLEADDRKLAKFYCERGDFLRLLDGLYSVLLYASGALATGKLSEKFYGNLMELDVDGTNLRVRYFKGPYNDEIICRSFPIMGPRQGVASAAFTSGVFQCRNKMEQELKEHGESWLKSMVAIPVLTKGKGMAVAGGIAVINVDSFVEGIFPEKGEGEHERMQKRANVLINLADRINGLRATNRLLKGQGDP